MANLKVTPKTTVTKTEINGKAVNQIKVSTRGVDVKRDGMLTITLPADQAPWEINGKSVTRAEFWKSLELGPEEALEITETVIIRYVP